MPTQVFRLPDFYRETYDPIAQRTLVRQLELWLTSLGSEVNQLSAAGGPTGDYAPLVHQHSLGDIPDLASTYATKLELSQLKWGDLADVTTTGTPGLYAVRYTGAEFVLETLPPGSAPPNTYSRMFDGLQYTNASGSDTLRFRSADNKLSIAVFDDDPTFGDNVRFTINQANIDHDALANFEALEHVNHSAVSINPGTGLTGGGDISATRTLNLADTAVTPGTYGSATQAGQFTVDQQGRLTAAVGIDIDHDQLLNFVALEHVDHSAVTLTAGTGLTGGGDISASRTFDLADTAVTPASYGTASQVPQFTVDQQGRLTLAANVAIAIDAAAVVSGQFLDALIQQSNVTQHQAALTIDWPQLTNLPDIVYQSGAQVITGNKTFNVAQYFGANIEQTAGWFISSAGTRMGLGGLPNLTGSILQVYGSADIDGGSLNFRSGAAVNNVLYTGGLETMILRNFGTEPSTLLEIRSKAGNPLTDIREATLALTRTDDAGNAEFLDLYNNGYHTGSPASVQHGLRIQKRGTGEYRPFVFDWYDGTTYTPGFTADSVTGFDFSLDVAAPEFVEGGTSLAAKYAPIVHAHDDLYYTEAEIDAFLLNYNPVENGFVSRAETAISFVDGTRTFTITPTGASFEFWASGDRFVKSGPESIVIPDIEGIHFIYYDAAGALQVVQVFNLDIIATFCFVAAVYWDATNNVSIIFGDERHGRQMDSATHLWAHASFGSLYGNGFQPGNLSMDGNGNLAAHAQLSVSNGQFRDEDITHDITDGSPQEMDPILQAPVLYRSGANGDWRKVAATDYPVTTAGTGRAAYNLFSGGVWSLAEAGNNNYVLIHLFATNDTRHPIVSIAGQNEYNNLNDARSAAPLELNELQFGGLASLLLEFIPIATFIVQTAAGMSNAVKSAFRTTEEGDDFIDWREQRSVSGSGAASSNHSNLSGLGNDDHPQYHTDARGDARYSQLGHTHPISDITNLQTELDGKEPDLGVPAADGYVLASTVAGVRSWVEMTGGAGGALGDLSDVTLTSPSAGHFLRYSGAAWLNTALAAGDIPSLDAGKITTGIFLDARIPNLNTSKLTAGTLGVARGGTGISSFTALNYIRAAGATTLEQRTPAQVLSDIGAAAASHTHTESQITDLGDYLPLAGGTLTGDLIVDGGVDHIIASSVGFVMRTAPAIGGWARGLVATDAADSRIGGAGFLGNNDTLTSYHIGFGNSWWAVDAVFTVDPSGNVAWDGELTGGSVPWARLTGVPDYLPLTGGTLTGTLSLTRADFQGHSQTIVSGLGNSAIFGGQSGSGWNWGDLILQARTDGFDRHIRFVAGTTPAEVANISSAGISELGTLLSAKYAPLSHTHDADYLKLNAGTTQTLQRASYQEQSFSWGGNTDLEWKRVLTLKSTSTSSWRACSFEVIYWDELGNHGNAIPHVYRARGRCIYSSNGTPTDDGAIEGTVGATNVIRLFKVGTRHWELQVKQAADWRLSGALVRIHHSTGDEDAFGDLSNGATVGTAETMTELEQYAGLLYAAELVEGGTSLASKYAPLSHTHDYLPLAGGTLTGQLDINRTASGNVLLRFATDRPWNFQQIGEDASAFLLLYAESGGKEFQIGSAADIDAFRFNPDSGTFTAAGTITAGGNLSALGEYIYGDSKEIIRFSDSWLRLNQAGDFTSGIYCGNSILRTDNTIQVGSSGATFAVSSGAFTYQGSKVWHAGNISDHWNNSDLSHNAYSDFNSLTGFGPRYVQGNTNGPGIPSATQYYNINLGLGNQYLYSQYAMQMAVPRTPLGGNPYLSFRYNENGTWGSWQKVYAGFADDAAMVTLSNGATVVAGGIAGPRFTTPHGYIEFGPANSSYAHIYTDRPSFYFNKDLRVNNVLVSLNGHTHAAGDITSGTMATARLGSGTANSSTFLRGDGAWATPTASVAALSDIGDVLITSVGFGEVLTWSGAAWINRTLGEAGIAASSHNHSAANITSGTMATARLGSGTANSSTFLRGDSTWAAVEGSPPETSFTLNTSLATTATTDSVTATLPAGWTLSTTVPIWLNVVFNVGSVRTPMRVPLFSDQPIGSSSSDGTHVIAGAYGIGAYGRVRRFSATQYRITTYTTSHGINKVWFSRY